MILAVSIGSQEKGLMAGIAVGGVIAFEALFAGPISGASMDPVRSLGPAFVSGRMESLWVYLIASVLGAAAGLIGFRAMMSGKTVSADDNQAASTSKATEQATKSL